jgi:hypothetical protein
MSLPPTNGTAGVHDQKLDSEVSQANAAPAKTPEFEVTVPSSQEARPA